MKNIKTIGFFFVMLSFIGLQTSSAQSTKAESLFKMHINNVVQKVKKAEGANQKRELLNSSFDKLLIGIKKVEKMDILSEENLWALGQFKQDIRDKKNELNGLVGFGRIPDSQLNNFADFLQQDFEQANLLLILGITLLVILLLPSIIFGILM